MERRRLADGIVVVVPESLERRGIPAVFTERTGGVSERPFDTLNLGFRTGDGRARVRRNRERLSAALGIGGFTAARQVHGAAARRVGADLAGAGYASSATAVPETDALITARRGTPLAVLVADCVPVVLARDDAVAVVHAGWRGLAAGIVERTLRRFRRERPAAAIGPAIGPCHYEVGADVAAAVVAGSPAGAVVDRRGGRTFVDLGATVEAVLRHHGVSEIDRSAECTSCHAERFFSHRRDGTTGRQAVVAWLR